MSCFFCEVGLQKLCQQIYEDDICYAVLENEQSVRGYTLVIMKPHKDNFFADNIEETELVAFWRAVQKISKAIKATLKPENIYVCSLCDGVKHFHVHLIPRYKWSEKDKARYREIFEPRNGKEAVDKQIESELISGFWWMGEKEIDIYNTDFMKLPPEGRETLLRNLARRLQQAICQI